MLAAQLPLVGVHFLLYLLSRCIPKADFLRSKMARYLYYNGSIRFFMEGFMDFTMFALMNLKHLDWSGDFEIVTASNYLAIFLTSLTLALPIFMTIQYARNLNRWNREEFQEKYGALLENTNLAFKERQWVVLLVPLAFFLRRLSLCVCVVFWIDVFWAQIAAQLMTSVFVIILLWWSRPLESNFAT